VNLSYDLVLVVLLITAAGVASKPLSVLVSLPTPGEFLPESIRPRIRALQSIVRNSSLMGVGALVAYFLNWPIPWLFRVLLGLYGLQALAQGIAMWREGAKLLQKPPTEFSQTPFDGLILTPSTPNTDVGRDLDFDLFLSYKSKDVHFARAVADRLISTGLRVWFAEYAIPLLDQKDLLSMDGDDPDRWLRSVIGSGIGRSRFGAAFTNDLYVDKTESQYCRYEVDQMLSSQGAESGRLVEILLPNEPGPHRFKPELAKCPHHAPDWEAVAASDPDGVAGFILSEFEYQAKLPDLLIPDSGLPTMVEDETWGYTLDVSGWEIDSSAPLPPGGRAFRCAVGDHTLKLNVLVGTGTVAPRPREASQKDRDVYDGSIRFAHDFLSANKSRSAGVHLFFHRDYSHFCVAYWSGQLWVRRYSIVLPGLSNAAEFALAFGFEGRFADYLRAVPIMDRVASSLDWGGQQ